MNAQGKQKLIKSIKPYIQKWMDDTDPNSSDSTDIGLIGDRTVDLMAELVITALDINSESQEYAIREGYLTA